MFATLIASVALATLQAPPKCQISLSLSPVEPLSEANFISAIRDQVRMGIQSSYVNVKWSDFTNEQAFNLKPLNDQLGIAKFVGGDIVFCLKPIDTSNRSVPASLNNFKFDSPEMLQAWEDSLLQIAKALPPDVKAIALGNEVDVYFSEHPDELDAYLNLVRTSRALLKGAGIKAPLGVITTYEGLIKRPELIRKIHSQFDVVMMTYYPIDSSFQVFPMKEINKNFDQMVGFAGSKPLILTEIGCPSGIANGSSEETQAEFVKQVFLNLKRYETRVPYANYFIQTDWGNQVLDYLETYYRLKDERFRAYLGTLGLSKSDGTKKKAYFEFKKLSQAWNND